MRLVSARWLLLLVWTGLAGGTIANAALPMTGQFVPQLQAVDTMLQTFMDGKPIPGATIAITYRDQVIYERGIGYSNNARTVPMRETALMRLASVTKPITASAINQLAKDGQLSLNAKVFNIAGNGGILDIDPFNGTYGDARLRDITVRHLLEHRGGWNRDTAGDLAFRDIQIANAMGVPSPAGIENSAKYILNQPLQFTPGSTSNYSNIGYMFLGMVVEEVAGQPYESYVDSHVLAPAGIPTWEINAGRTFAADQDPREPVYSSNSFSQNVYNPPWPVQSPYGGWDHEKALAYGGLIGSAKAIALLAQERITAGPEIGKLRTDYTTHTNYTWIHTGSLTGTNTIMLQSSARDWTFSILLDRRPSDGSSYTSPLIDSMQSILSDLRVWPSALVYDGDFTNDQWLMADDIDLFKQAVLLGGQAAFNAVFPSARYLAGDFNGDGSVSIADLAGFVGSLEYAGVPSEYISLLDGFTQPGDFNGDGSVDGADFVIWQTSFPNTSGAATQSMGDANGDGNVDGADFVIWQTHFPTVASGQPFPVPEPGAWMLAVLGLVCTGVGFRGRRA